MTLEQNSKSEEMLEGRALKTRCMSSPILHITIVTKTRHQEPGYGACPFSLIAGVPQGGTWKAQDGSPRRHRWINRFYQP